METITQDVTDDNFINSWLSHRPSNPAYTKFHHVKLIEAQDSRETLFDLIASTIYIHHNPPNEFIDILSQLGFPRSAGIYDARPQNSNTRKGNFGEVIAAEYLRQCEDCELPVYRLRFNPNPDESMKGEDVLAFKYGNPDGSDREIFLVEAKVRSTYSSQSVEDAYEQCSDSERPRPKSILFVARILTLSGQDDEAQKVIGFINPFTSNPPVQRHLIFLITGNQPRKAFQCIQDKRKVIQNLSAVELFIDSLGDFVNNLFNFEVDNVES